MSAFGRVATTASGGVVPNWIEANGFKGEALEMLLRGAI
jgi:hypothetical protein